MSGCPSKADEKSCCADWCAHGGELKGHPALASVVRELDHNWGRCLALYVHGSVAFGYKDPSDIDLLAVVDEPTLKPVHSNLKDSQFKIGPFEVSVYSRSFWLQKLAKMDLTMLVCLSLPSKFILCEDENFAEEVGCVAINQQQLARTGVSYAEFTWLQAKRYLQGNRVNKSCKVVSYVFRILNFTAQALQLGRITDLSAANVWWNRIESAFEELAIGPGDWDIIEAAFGRSFQLEVRHVHDLASDTKVRCRPALSAQQPIRWNFHCHVCWKAVDQPEDVWNLAAESDGSVVVLPTCGHRLHRTCAASLSRASDGPAACPVCHQRWRLKLRENALAKQESEVRGIWLHVQTRMPIRKHASPDEASTEEAAEAIDTEAPIQYGGYPATVLLDEEMQPSVADAVRVRDGWVGTVCRMVDASESQEPACMVRFSDGDVQQHRIQDLDCLAGAAKVVTLSLEEGEIVGRFLSGSEAFKISSFVTSGLSNMIDLRTKISELVRMHMGAVTLLASGSVLDDATSFHVGSLPLAKLAPAVHDHLEARQRWMNTLARTREEHRRAKQERIAERAERARVREEAARQWEALRQETARLSGLGLRVKNVPFWRDLERDFRRCKSQLKRKQCRARAIAAKDTMLTTPSARQRSDRRISDGRKFSGRYGGFVCVDDCFLLGEDPHLGLPF